jgi:hypothetical protein
MLPRCKANAHEPASFHNSVIIDENGAAISLEGLRNAIGRTLDSHGRPRELSIVNISGTNATLFQCARRCFARRNRLRFRTAEHRLI